MRERPDGHPAPLRFAPASPSATRPRPIPSIQTSLLTAMPVWLGQMLPGLRMAGAALTGFSGSLLAMYARTPSMRKPGSIWPSRTGIAVSKDVWMLGIGIGLVADGLTHPGQNAAG